MSVPTHKSCSKCTVVRLYSRCCSAKGSCKWRRWSISCLFSHSLQAGTSGRMP
uniref:hypothetical protein n=1 Tax=Prevotella intermedia TaxID=28131 RepID=UPI0037436037